MLLLHILRGVFVLIVASIAFLYADQVPGMKEKPEASILFAVMGAFLIIVVDMVWPRKSLRALAGVLFGLLAGMLVTYVFSLIASFLASVFMPSIEIGDNPRTALQFIKFMVGAVSCYVTISFVMQTKDDFRFVIPYVEFSRQTKGGRPFLLDTSVIIDGRIADICKTGVIESEVIIPRFVLQELQNIADSSDRMKRKRGRRGLDVLNTMQADKSIDLVIRELGPSAGQEKGTVDERLVEAAKIIDGRLVTTDYNLNKIARLRGVEVININDLANALKPVFLPGEGLKLKIVKAGEEPGQGVGYLDDGTMVVVEQAKDRIGKTVDVLVTSALQTSAGRLIFGKLSDGGNQHNSHRRS
ncbi:MAG: TRAM domain-containing protein [Actinobacteria bacterium]|nr:TRAM domain-containing protein [Actinomycetota bacterium]